MLPGNTFDTFKDDMYAEWRRHARCRAFDHEIFFPDVESKFFSARAKLVCWGLPGETPCPVLMDCLAYAVDTAVEPGIFGGYTTQERRALRRRLREKAPEHRDRVLRVHVDVKQRRDEKLIASYLAQESRWEAKQERVREVSNG